MSFDIQRKLNIIENAKENPEKVLTELFTKDVSDNKLLREIEIQKEEAFIYLAECVCKIEAFSDCILKFDGTHLFVYVRSIREALHDGLFHKEDKIIKIDTCKKQYKICTIDVDFYKEIINKEYELTALPICDFLLQAKNYNIFTRIKTVIFLSPQNIQMLWEKLRRFVILDPKFYLFSCRKSVEKTANYCIAQIEEKNEKHKRNYNMRLEVQKYYRQDAPEHMNMIYEK